MTARRRRSPVAVAVAVAVVVVVAVGACVAAPPGPDEPADASPVDACAADDPCDVYASTYYDGLAAIEDAHGACAADADCARTSSAISCATSDRSVDACGLHVNADTIDAARADLDALADVVCAACFDGCGSFAVCEETTPACVDGRCVGVAPRDAP